MTIAESKNSYYLSKTQLHKDSPEFKSKTKNESRTTNINTETTSSKKADSDEGSHDECKTRTSENIDNKPKSKQNKESPPFYPSKPSESVSKEKSKIGLRKESRPFMVCNSSADIILQEPKPVKSKLSTKSGLFKSKFLKDQSK